ncbi:hypothetical protein QQ045_026816 [Rhodiola kirilowii]
MVPYSAYKTLMAWYLSDDGVSISRSRPWLWRQVLLESGCRFIDSRCTLCAGMGAKGQAGVAKEENKHEKTVLS